MNARTKRHALTALVFGGLLGTSGLHAQQNPEAWQIEVTPVRGGVFMIGGAGGNVAVFPGREGVFMVDAGMSEFAEEILTKVRELAAQTGTDPSIRYLVNTHWHFDHTGGNPSFAQSGATLVAHEGVLRLVSEDQVLNALDDRPVAALPPEGRPILTFNDRLNLSWNGDLIHVVHMPGAHSSGDVIVHIRDADVIHMGDLFFNGMYPFIDVDHGGNVEGMVAALDEVLAHSRPTTLFIPGHGPLADRTDLTGYCSMLRTVQDRIRSMMDDGKSREEVIAAHPTGEFDADWGQAGGFADPDRWVGLVYDGMMRSR